MALIISIKIKSSNEGHLQLLIHGVWQCNLWLVATILYESELHEADDATG